MSDNCIVVVASDLHTGSTVGLSPPYVQLDDGGTHKASKLQRWFWRNWLDTWAFYKELKEKEQLPLVFVLNGDAADGDHHDTPQVITRNKATQLRIAVKTLEPTFDVVDKFFIMRGTESHVGKSAWIEEILAEDIGAEKCSDEMHSWWHLYANFGGVTFDIKHHPEAGSGRPWTAANPANTIAYMVSSKYALDGKKPPDVAVRAHRHTFMDNGTTYKTRVFQTPPWQFSTAFVHRIGMGGDPPVCGSIYFVCRDGRYFYDKKFYEVKRGNPVKVKF